MHYTEKAYDFFLQSIYPFLPFLTMKKNLTMTTRKGVTRHLTFYETRMLLSNMIGDKKEPILNEMSFFTHVKEGVFSWDYVQRACFKAWRKHDLIGKCSNKELRGVISMLDRNPFTACLYVRHATYIFITTTNLLDIQFLLLSTRDVSQACFIYYFSILL